MQDPRVSSQRWKMLPRGMELNRDTKLPLMTATVGAESISSPVASRYARGEEPVC